MGYPSDRRYTKDHEWIRWQGGAATVGITDFAQSELGDIVYIELPKLGKQLRVHDQLCVVESTKAASDVYAPVTGTVIEVNTRLSDAPELLNKNPHEDGWIAKLSGVNEAELTALLSAADYEKLVSK